VMLPCREASSAGSSGLVSLLKEISGSVFPPGLKAGASE
jgi:hypothetical protein